MGWRYRVFWALLKKKQKKCLQYIQKQKHTNLPVSWYTIATAPSYLNNKVITVLITTVITKFSNTSLHIVLIKSAIQKCISICPCKWTSIRETGSQVTSPSLGWVVIIIGVSLTYLTTRHNQNGCNR